MVAVVTVVVGHRDCLIVGHEQSKQTQHRNTTEKVAAAQSR